MIVKIKKFDFLRIRASIDADLQTQQEAAAVRIRATGRDKYAGLRGHDYIKARQLDVKVKRL